MILTLACGRETTPQPTRPILGSEPRELPAVGGAHEGKVDSGSVDPFSVTLAEGDSLEVVAEQHGIDVALLVIDPAGGVVMRVDSPTGREGQERALLVAEAAGVYRVDVEGLGADPEGSYRLTTAARGPADPRQRRRAQAVQAFAQAEELRRQGDKPSLEQAVEDYQQAADIWNELGETTEVATAWRQLLESLEKLGRHAEAVQAGYRALPLLAQTGDLESEARLATLMARSLKHLAEPEEAETLDRRAFGLWQQLGDRHGEATVLDHRARLAADRGELRRAQRLYKDAISVWENLEQPRNQAISHTGLAQLYTDAGEPDLALAELQRAEELLGHDVAAKDRALVLEQRARAARRLNQPEEARQTLQEALEIRSGISDLQGQAAVLSDLAGLDHEAGKHAQAFELYSRSLLLYQQLNDHIAAAIVLQNLGWVRYRQRDFEAALELYRRALPVLREAGHRRGEAAVLLGLARAERKLGNLAVAWARAEGALVAVETLRAGWDRPDLRSAVLADKRHYYDAAIDVLLDLHARDPSAGHDAAAFQLSERARARWLLDALPDAWSTETRPVPTEVELSRRRVRHRVNQAEERRRALVSQGAEPGKQLQTEAELLATLAELRQLVVNTASGDTDLAPLEVRELQRDLLGEGTLLLHFHLGEERSYLWAVWAEGLECFLLPRRSRIEEVAAEAYRLLTVSWMRQSARSTRSATAVLGRMLLGPVVSRLPAYKRLLVAADGALVRIPFGVLPLPEEGEVRQGEPHQENSWGSAVLLDRYEVVYAPSGSVLAWMRRELAGRARKPRTLAAFGDPVFSAEDLEARRHRASSARGGGALPGFGAGPEELSRLRHSREEVLAIADLVPHRDRLIFLGLEAAKRQVTSARLAGYRILHFATHGLVNSRHAELSGLALSRVDAAGQPQDGVLWAHEISDLRLDADLVVLSACETALGKKLGSEGLVGLSHAFFRAGARGVLVSLWQVNDTSTARLMARFYREMLTTGLSPAEALRRARLALRKERPEPYYWAAFVLQGEG